MMVCIACLSAKGQTDADYSQNFYAIKTNSDAYFDSIRQQLQIQGITSMAGTGYTQYTRWLDEWEPLVYPSGDFQAAFAGKTALEAAKASQTFPFISVAWNWDELGPTSSPNNSGVRNGSTGRLEYITANPLNGNELYVTSKQGGLYYSRNNGDYWENGGTDKLPFPGVSSVAVEPADNLHWIVSSWATGGAMYETIDGGANWVNISAGLPAQWLLWNTIQLNEVVPDPNNFNVLYLATSYGLYTRNAADATPLWEKVYPVGSEIRIFDVEFDPSNPLNIYATGEIVIHSTDGGLTWNEMASTIPMTAPITASIYTGLVKFEITTDDTHKIYMVVTGQDLSVPNGGNMPSSLYMYDATNGQWTLQGAPGGLTMIGGRFRAIAVNPNDSEVLYTGNVSRVKQSTDAGSTWNNLLPVMMHDDKQDFLFTHSGTVLWCVHDGGVSKGTFHQSARSPSFVDKTVNIGVARSHAISINKYSSENIMVGSYDKGTDVYYRSVDQWWHCSGGDGYSNMIDYDDPNYMYSTPIGGHVYRANDGFLSGAFNNVTPPQNTSDWQTWIAMSQQDPKIIYRNGIDLVKSTDRGNFGSWTTILNAPAFDSNYDKILRVWKAPNHENVCYARLLGPTGTASKIVRTFDENNVNPQSTWEDVALPEDYWIRDIAIDEEDPSKFWIAYAGLQPGFVQKVWYYNGTAFVALPDLPDYVSVNSIEHEHGTDNRVYIGSTAGVLVYDDTSGEWLELEGLPRNKVAQMAIDYCSRKLIVGIFGRGVWEADLRAPVNSPRIISGTETISTRVDIYTDIIIPSGATLNVTGEVHMAADKQIVVEIGGRLIVAGGILTKQCDQQWGGIIVKGDVFASQFTQSNGLLGQG
jgi:hypothetical protein